MKLVELLNMFVVISACMRYVFLILLFSDLSQRGKCDISFKTNSNKFTSDVKDSISPNVDDFLDCELLDFCSDKVGFDAIRALHYQLDDDANGDVDVTETDEFLRGELKYENGYERQKGFHRNDKHITVDELWKTWKSSEVHNWTVEETITWLVSNVELPQYAETFQENEVNGSTLPRMAISSTHFLSNVLGIKDPIHKQKISLKAMDVVLFGTPKSHNYVKDVVLVFSLIIATGGCWFAYAQHKYSQSQMKKMMKDMESLQHAEDSLSDMQKELDQAKIEQEIVANEKKKLELRLQDEITTVKQQDLSLSLDADQSKIIKLEEELRRILDNLHVAEKALQAKSWVPPPALQHWLQMTHELELRHYNGKKAAAEQQLAAAKEGCEKLRKKRSTFMGAFRVAHGSSIDDVDNRILQAKAALSEVTMDLQERLHRWKQMEILCGFPIVHNPGLQRLHSLLGSAMKSGIISSHANVKQRINRSGSENTLTDDDSSFSSGVSAIQQLVHNSATLFLAPLPSSFVDRFNNSTSIPNYSSSISPCKEGMCSKAPLNHQSYIVSSNEQSVVNGSLVNIPSGCSPCLGMRSDASQIPTRKSLTSELKPCASSNAILQRSDAICAEHPTEMLVVEENQKDIFDLNVGDTSNHSTTASPFLRRPVFTVGGSSKDIILRSPTNANLKSSSHDNSKDNISSTSKGFLPLESSLKPLELKENCNLQPEFNPEKATSLDCSIQEEKDFNSNAGDGKFVNKKSVTVQWNQQKIKIS